MSSLKNIKEQLFFGSLVLVMFTLPLPKYSINSQSIIVCILCWLFYSTLKEKYLNLRKNFNLFLLLSSLFWLALFGLLYTQNLDRGFRNLELQLPLLVLPLILLSVDISAQNRYVILKYFSWGVVIAAVYALIKAAYFDFYNLGNFYYYDQFGILLNKHTTYFALFVLVALAYFNSVILKSSWKYRKIETSAILFLLGTLYLLSVRVSIVALIVCTLIMVFGFRKQIKRSNFILFIASLVILSFTYFTPNFQKRFNAKTPEGIEITDLGTRKLHWKSALQIIGQNNFLIGAGTGDGHTGLYEQYRLNNFETGYVHKYNAHNQFIETTLFHGALGLLLLVILLAVFIIKFYNANFILGLGVISAFIIFMMTESILERQSGVVLFSFFLSLFATIKPSTEKENQKSKYLLIGPYGAVGGVSVHVKRLSELLSNYYIVSFIDESPTNNLNPDIFNLRSKNIFKYLKLISATNVVHIHSGKWYLLCFHVMAAKLFQKRIIITLHWAGIIPNGFSFWIMRRILGFASETIVVSKEISEKLKLKNVQIIPAFLPPNISEEPELPQEIVDILYRNEKNKLVVGNAFKLDIYNNQDLYGLDLLIDVARRLKSESKSIMILFIVGEPNDKNKMYDGYLKTIKEENLESNINIIPYPISFIKLIQKSDLVVRPTNIDGDALTIREALFLNKPIIASDAVIRPKGTILFINRNSEDLYQKILETVEGIRNNAVEDKGEYTMTYYRDLYSILIQKK